ncbi:BRCA2, helical [Musa troglodytarum]|uniref:BRCA2, helical n=1 Tax=Musa troglodytarum TaxID=320322 RepID=A0A9E7FYX4_9LILI|nr:BRCA2, helical [Musa troglodytarum]
MIKRRPFFNPRKSVNLSNLVTDIATMILHVEDVCMSERQKKQWIFITDGCNCSSTSQYYEQRDCLLAVSFSSPMVDKDLFSHHHEGTVYKVIKVLHFSSMTNAFQGFNGEVRFAALLLPQVKTQKIGIEEAVYSGISILVRGNTKILYQIHVAWYRLQRG